MDHAHPELQVGPARFLATLLREGGARPSPSPLTRTRAPGGAPRMRWMAEALKRDALGWLCREGGWVRRQVVVGGRREEGRLWDARVAAKLDLRFGPAPLHLLLGVLSDPDPLPRLLPGTIAAVGAGVSGDAPATGDVLAIHRIVSLLRGGARPLAEWTQAPPPRPTTTEDAEPNEEPRRGRARGKGVRRTKAERPRPEPSEPPLAPQPPRERWRTLLALSPLTCAFRPDEAGELDSPDAAGEAALTARLRPLFRGDRAAVLSYLDEALARAWLRQEEARRRLQPQDALASYLATARTLRAYVRAAEGRPSALRPLIAFFQHYVLRRFGGRAPVGEALRAQAQGYNRASEREAFLRGAAELFALGDAVTLAVERALEEAYVDRTEEQKVLLADYHERFRAVGPEVVAIRRELAGLIG